jgi:predicted AAA+ superfamily ATPase
MANFYRYLQNNVAEDLKHKMVFIGGPRQVGKTTFSLSFLKNGSIDSPAYLNWDDLESKQLIRSGQLPADQPLVILDEIHKYAQWRNLLKGFYDKRRLQHKFIVTGSARLDHYRKGGDSLVGRYHYYRLHPLSVSELNLADTSAIHTLLRLGGFPDPYLRGEEVFAKRWRRERLARIFNEDLRDLEHVREVTSMESLAQLLPQVVGSQLSYQSLGQQIEVSFKTVQHWISILDNLYITFRINPYVSGKLRLAKKTHRLYFWDWGELNDRPGPQFENLVASHLLKYCHFLEDTQGDKMELRYLRDTDGREVDFVILKNRRPLFAVECKTGDRAAAPALSYFSERLPIPHFYQVHLGTKHFLPQPNIEVIPFARFCQNVGIP